ncbi:MAG: sigma factor-like helix-turn-helix DNA-binding protein, partial [Sciscionella sp.]
LGESDRRLLSLVVVDGYSLGEAAEQLGLSVSAAKSRLHRTRARLRARTDDHLLADPLRQSGGSR